MLVIPIFLTARALSHSVQSMDRYHEEFYRLKDKQQAIVVSYSHLFPPAIASIVTDGIGLLVVAVAPIPLIQKVAIFASFWVVSIFISVVTLHPIILSYINPPPQPHERTAAKTRAGQHLGGARDRGGRGRRAPPIAAAQDRHGIVLGDARVPAHLPGRWPGTGCTTASASTPSCTTLDDRRQRGLRAAGS